MSLHQICRILLSSTSSFIVERDIPQILLCDPPSQIAVPESISKAALSKEYPPTKHKAVSNHLTLAVEVQNSPTWQLSQQRQTNTNYPPYPTFQNFLQAINLLQPTSQKTSGGRRTSNEKQGNHFARSTGPWREFSCNRFINFMTCTLIFGSTAASAELVNPVPKILFNRPWAWSDLPYQLTFPTHG